MTFFLQLIVTGLAQGMIYALIAIGFVIILKCSEVFNIAQGHFVLIGGYLGWTFLVPFNLPIWAALLASIGVAMVMGLLIERLMLRPLVGQPVLAVVMMTIALATVLGGLATLLWGAEYKAYHGMLPTINMSFGSVSVPSESLIGLMVSVFCVSILMLVFKYTKIGLAMRATAEDLQVVQSVGASRPTRSTPSPGSSPASWASSAESCWAGFRGPTWNWPISASRPLPWFCWAGSTPSGGPSWPGSSWACLRTWPPATWTPFYLGAGWPRFSRFS